MAWGLRAHRPSFSASRRLAGIGDVGRAAMRFGALTFLSQSARRREIAREAGAERMLVRPPDYWSGNREAEEAAAPSPIKTGDAAYDALIARRTRVLRAARPPRSMPRGLPSTVHRRGVSMAGPQTGPGSVVRRLTPAPVRVAPNPASTNAKVTTTLSPAPTTPRGSRGRSGQRTSTRGGTDRPGHPAPARPATFSADLTTPGGSGAAENAAAISTPSFDAILGSAAAPDVQVAESAVARWFNPIGSTSISSTPVTSAAVVGARRAAGVLPSAARSVHSASAHQNATHPSSTDHATVARRFAPRDALAGRLPWSDVRRLPVAGPSFIATRVGVAGTEQAPTGGELRRNANGTGVRWVVPQSPRSSSSVPATPARPRLTPQRAFAVAGSAAVTRPVVRRTPASVQGSAATPTSPTSSEWGRVEPAALARVVPTPLLRASTDPIGREPARSTTPSIQPVAQVSARAWGRVGPSAVGDVLRRSLIGRADMVTRGATFAERAAEVFGRTPTSPPVAPPRGVPARASEHLGADAPARRARASRTPRGHAAQVPGPTVAGRPAPRADGRRPESFAPLTTARTTPGPVRRTPTTTAHWADPTPAPEHTAAPSAATSADVGRPAWPGGLFATAAGVRADAVMRLSVVRAGSAQGRATSPLAAIRTIARPGTVLSTSTTHAPLRRSAEATAAASAEHAGAAAPLSWSQRAVADAVTPGRGTSSVVSSDGWITRVATAGGSFDIRRIPIARLPFAIGDRPVARSAQQSQSAAGFDVRRMPVGGPMVVSLGARTPDASYAEAAVRRTPGRSVTSPPATWAARVAAVARRANDLHRLPIGTARLQTATPTGSAAAGSMASGSTALGPRAARSALARPGTTSHESPSSGSLAARVAAVWGESASSFDARRMPVGAPPLVPASRSTDAGRLGGDLGTTTRRDRDQSERVTAQRLPAAMQPTSARAVAARSIAPLAIGLSPDERQHTTASPSVRAAQLLPNSAPRQRDLGAELVRRAMALPMAPPALVAGSSNVLPGIRSTRSAPGIRRATNAPQPTSASTAAPMSTAARLNELVASGAFEGTAPVRRTPAPAASAPSSVAAERFDTVLRAATIADRPVALPARFRPLAERIVGPRIAVQVVHGAVTRRALEAAGHDAATTDRTIHLPSRPDASAHTMSIVAHELEHVAAPSPAPRFHGGPSSAEETRATRTEQVVRRLARTVESRNDTAMGTAGLPVGGLTAFGRSGAGAPAAPASARAASPSSTSTSGSSSSRSSSGSSDTTINRMIDDSSPPARRPPQPVRRGSGSIRRLVSNDTMSADQGESTQSDTNPALSPAQLSAIIRAVEDRLLEEIERRGGLWRGSF